jgi:biopolymer transport protein ExbD
MKSKTPMAINLRYTKGSDEPELMMDINTTPLIDVMLVLLVMLIITIPIQLHSVSLEMPVSAPPTTQAKPEKIQIDIDGASVVYWQGVALNPEALDEKMKAISQQGTQAELHIRPNKDARYAVFANVLASSKRAGLTKIAVIGAEQFVQ